MHRTTALTHWVTLTNFIPILENPEVPDLARCEQALVMWILLAEGKPLDFAKYSLIDQHLDLASSSGPDLILLRL